MKRIVLAHAARDDILEIQYYLFENAGPKVADRVVSDLYRAIQKLVKSPGLGHRREDPTAHPVRIWLVHSYDVIYEPDSRPLAVARILHAARDICSILDDSA